MGCFWSKKQPEKNAEPVYQRTVPIYRPVVSPVYPRIEPPAKIIIPFEKDWLEIM